MDILTYRLRQLAAKVHQLIADIRQVPPGGSVGQVLTKQTSQDFAATWMDPASAGGGAWGSITGSLSAQTDLQAALNAREPAIAAGGSTQYWRGDKTWQSLNKAAVGLGNVDNTSDADKPVSTAQQTALNLKIDATAISAFGLTLVDDADAATARATLGLGTAATQPSSAFQPAGSYLTANQTITLSGDALGSGATAITVTLATVNSNTGTFGGATTSPQISVNGKGLVTGVSAVTITPAWTNITGTPTTRAGYGITDAQQLNANLTAYAGANWTAGVQVPTLTAANTVALKTVGSATGNLLDKASGDSLYQPLSTLLTNVAALSGTSGFLKKTGANTLALDTSTYLTANQTVTLSGDISGSGATAITTAIGANKVTRGMLAATSGAAILGATTAGNVSDLTGTQTTALLDAMGGANGTTGGTKGLVPAPAATDNVKFLKGDGTWAAPTASATAGGSSGNVQYNNATAIAGAANLNVNASGNLQVSYASASTTPPADSLEFAFERLLASGGRVLPRFKDESAVFWTMQPHLGRNSVAWAQGTGSTTPTFSAINLTAAGTATSRVPAATNRLTRTRRIAYVSTATAGSDAGIYSGSLSAYSLGSGTVAGGGGFFAVFRWGASDAAAVASAHMFIGMQNSIAAPTATTNPSTFTNAVGIAQLNGGSNLNIVFGGSAAQTPIDLGASFPAAGLSTDLYELILYAPPGSNNTVYYHVERINTGDVASGTLTGTAGTGLPANSTFLGPRMYRSNNATALAVGIDVAGFTIESDF